MNKQDVYTVLGIMTGTSMDGIDFSLIKTNGKNYVNIISEKNYEYTLMYQKKLKNIIHNKPNTNKKIISYFYSYEDEITNHLIYYIKKFLKKFNIKNIEIDLIGLSGQTFYHNPKKKISIQLGSAKKISNYFKIKVISDFRSKDIAMNGQGAPIGAYYHKFLINNINTKAIIINLGGVANFSLINKGKLISSDLGPGNSMSDDLMSYFFNKKYDLFGKVASKGISNKNIIKLFTKDKFFKKKFPKSLDRNYFKRYFKLMKKLNKYDAVSTAINLTIISILNLKYLKNNFNQIILSGGGRKNKYLLKVLKKELLNFNINLIDNYNYSGDMLEAQMFGYLAVRSIKKLVISSPTTTGVKKPITGGELYNFN